MNGLNYGWWVAVASVLLLAVGIALLWGGRQGPDGSFPVNDREIFVIEGLSYLQENSELVLLIKIGKAELRRPRFGFLAVGPRSQLALLDLRARIEVLNPDAERIDVSIESVQKGLLALIPASARNTVRRIVIETLRVEFVTPEVDGVVLSAATASLVGKQRVRLSGGLSIVTPGGDRLHAREADWSWGSEQLTIRGPYTLLDTEGRHSGADSRIGVDSQGHLEVLGP